MDFADKKLICRDCQKEFIWTKGEQEFFAKKGFDRPPIRCLECRKKKRERNDTKKTTTELYTIVCSGCGKSTEVNFKPRGTGEIFCAECFSKNSNR